MALSHLPASELICHVAETRKASCDCRHILFFKQPHWAQIRIPCNVSIYVYTSFLVYPELCSHHHHVLEHFLSPPKRTPTPNSSHFLLISKPLAPGNHKCAFSPCRFTSSGYFMSIESYEKWSLWPASFTLLILNVHPGCGMSWDFIPFCGQIPHYMDMPHFIYLFFGW